ncbi:MAG: NAD(P)/FAD-dependent oxidoreductase [Phycisphaerae bacterium]|nr:NAD(P)/FAD-dependent oxidoreductase [Phycisphaerae bacterium]
MADRAPVIVIGGGFTGLSCAYELAKNGVSVVVLEKESDLGGMASSFKIKGKNIEKFYHHCFCHDHSIINLAQQLGCGDQLTGTHSSVATYINGKFYRLSGPLDVLRFKPLNFRDRIRLGLLVLKASRIQDWKPLESLTAMEWLKGQCGPEVYRVVWEPLLRGKFGAHADTISAVWIWNKLKLRGTSRNWKRQEKLLYYRGGFALLVDRLSHAICKKGGNVRTRCDVSSIICSDNRVQAVKTSDGTIEAQSVVVATALPVAADLLSESIDSDYIASLRRIEHRANLCLVLELSERLSSFYWLNVNDPNVPFVAVIEHTNFQLPEDYAGKKIVYFSKYLSVSDPYYQMTGSEVLSSFLPHIKRMFPHFKDSWIENYYLWKSPYSQPVVGRDYSQIIPSVRTPINGLYLSTMAQIYPEDRGINYAVREGMYLGQLLVKQLSNN